MASFHQLIIKEITVGKVISVYKMCMLAGVSTMLAGCSSTSSYSALPPCRQLGAEYAPSDVKGESVANSPVPDVLQLTDALALALRSNPELAVFSYEVRAAEARVLQACVLPNPELELAVDEYDRDSTGFDSAETAVTLGQLFELGGKRRWRRRIAEAEGELAGWDYESKRLDVFTETAKRFTEVIAAQERLELSRSSVDLAEKITLAVAERVKAGKEPPLQAAKSEAELELARLDLEQAENAHGTARRNLAAMWGSEKALYNDVEGGIDDILETIPALDKLRIRLAQNPVLARWETELRLRRAVLRSEKAARIPDLQGSIGLVQFEEDGTDALAFGIGFPLPLFDRNQGNIAAAGQGIASAESERRAVEVELAAELAGTHAVLSTLHKRVTALRTKVVPAMEQAFESAHEGYKQGKFGFIDMLDAQRGLVEVRGALVDALSEYQSALIAIQRLTGTGIEELINNNKED